MTVIPLQISESAFQRRVIDYALVRGWHVSHARPAQIRPGRWATPITGHPGAPDLLLARAGTVLLVELKTAAGRLTPGQRGWLTAIGETGRCWRPADWPAIMGELA